MMTNQPILKTSARAKVVQAKGDFALAMRASGVRHCGSDLRPFDPPTCRFCGEGCGGECGM